MSFCWIAADTCFSHPSLLWKNCPGYLIDCSLLYLLYTLSGLQWLVILCFQFHAAFSHKLFQVCDPIPSGRLNQVELSPSALSVHALFSPNDRTGLWWRPLTSHFSISWRCITKAKQHIQETFTEASILRQWPYCMNNILYLQSLSCYVNSGGPFPSSVPATAQFQVCTGYKSGGH